MTSPARIAAAVLSALVTVAMAEAQPRADRIFINGTIWTGVPNEATSTALAVRGDRIIVVGSDATARALAGPRTQTIDLGGRLVVPGFNDAHWHLETREQADLAGAGSIEEIRRRLLAFAKNHPSGWLLGNGWAYTDFPGGMPDKKYLDDIFPNRPVYISERDGHMGVANSRAIAVARVSPTTADPISGRIEKDRSGALTGEFKEYAQDLIRKHIPPPSAAELMATVESLLDRAASYGLTSLQVASWLGPTEFGVIRRLQSNGRLKVRFRIAVPFDRAPTPAALRRYRQLRDQFPGPMIKYGIAKGMLDGTVDAKTAAMFDSYVGTNEDTGIPMWSQPDLDQAVAAYDKAGIQVELHAIGDKAIHMALDAYAHAARQNGTVDRRHRVEHVEVPLEADFPRFKQLGVIASTQATFANPDATALEHFAVLLGPERASRAEAFKQFDDAGAVQAFGSDHPVFSMEVLKGIFTAVTRTTPEGTPVGGWYPANRISVEAALRHFTKDAAYASFDDTVKGTLTAGKLADFVVLSENIITTPPDRIKATRIIRTVMGGKDTYLAR